LAEDVVRAMNDAAHILTGSIPSAAACESWNDPRTRFVD